MHHNVKNARINDKCKHATNTAFVFRTELGVCKHDLDKIERDLARVKEENERLRSDKSAMANGIEKGAREVLEAKDKEIDKLRDRVNVLEAEVDKLKAEKEALEKELEKVVKVRTFINL